MWTEFIIRTVDYCRRHAVAVASILVLASAAVGAYAVTHLTIDADVTNLLAKDLPWRKQIAVYEQSFPDTGDTLLVVIDGTTPEQADSAAGALAARLGANTALFKTVQRPDAGKFFRENGLLFLDPPELSDLADHLIQAQPMIGGLAADPSLRGLFGAFKLGLEGVQHGEIEASALDKPITAVAAAIKSTLAGSSAAVPWSEIFTGRKPGLAELRRFLITQPVLDYGDITPGARASEAIRMAARDLGLTPEHGVRVRLTGSVPLNDDELASVEQGAAVSTSVSVGVMLLVLFVAFRSVRLVGVAIAVLVAGFACTAGFAALAIGTLNVISVAFVVMFLGIAVDFAIQFTVRYRAERYRAGDDTKALQTTARRIGMPLSLAAGTTALGFLSFVPTDFRGVAELGLIAAAGMVIALILTFTLLPALLVLVRPAPERAAVGFRWTAALDRTLPRWQKPVLAVGAVLAIGAAATLPWVHFDFNPLHLKDPRTESMSTLLDLMSDPAANPYVVEILTPSVDAAVTLAKKLSALPEVERAVTLDSFIPEDQDKKLPIIEDLRFFLAPALNAASPLPPPTDDQLRKSAASLLATLRDVIGKAGREGGRGDMEEALTALSKANSETLAKIKTAVVPGVVGQLTQLRDALNAKPVDRASLPPDIVQAWVAPDGKSRIEVTPRGDVRNNEILARFRQAVESLAPDATGPGITIQASADTISHALVVAGITAAVTITIALLIALRRIRDTIYVLAPLILAALLTLATGVAIGLPLNFANVIALPLLLGIGVAFDIYFVTRWREGLPNILQSAAARAITFSALTTIGTFGTLGLSHHRGTAEMGVLLVIALGYALLTTLIFLPPLLALTPPQNR